MADKGSEASGEAGEAGAAAADTVDTPTAAAMAGGREEPAAIDDGEDGTPPAAAAALPAAEGVVNAEERDAAAPRPEATEREEGEGEGEATAQPPAPAPAPAAGTEGGFVEGHAPAAAAPPPAESEEPDIAPAEPATQPETPGPAAAPSTEGPITSHLDQATNTQVFAYGRSWFNQNEARNNNFCIKADPILEVACGDTHSAIVTEKGRLFTFGSNDWGQLGNRSNKRLNKPAKVVALTGETVLHVACGRNHTLASTATGRLYAFGSGEEGQLGTEACKSSNRPVLVEGLPPQRYRMVACGAEHSAAIDEDGRLFLWGDGSAGQLGMGSLTTRPKAKELKLKGVKSVASVACGYYHTAVITDRGALLTFGEGECGKLGLGESKLGDLDKPARVKLAEPVAAVACGSSHTLALTESGDVYGCGSNAQGQLGLGSGVDEVSEFSKLDLSAFKGRAEAVFCGDVHSGVVMSTGKALMFGSGHHGKLAVDGATAAGGDVLTPALASALPEGFRVRGLGLGGCHSLCLLEETEDGEESSDDEGSLSSAAEASVSGMSSDEEEEEGEEEEGAGEQPLPLVGLTPREKRRRLMSQAKGTPRTTKPVAEAAAPDDTTTEASDAPDPETAPSSTAEEAAAPATATATAPASSSVGGGRPGKRRWFRSAKPPPDAPTEGADSGDGAATPKARPPAPKSRACAIL